MLDMVPRYAPSHVLVTHGNFGAFNLPVHQYKVHLPNAHPAKCPIKPDMTVLELVTIAGSRWYGVERAYINSELRMVIAGFDSRDEVRSNWEVCKTV
jgi:hypothetical protein